MKVKVIKHVNDSEKPETVEVDSCFSIGEKLTITYDCSTEIRGINGNIKRWSTSTAEVEVIDIVCNMITLPEETWVCLKTEDPLFLELIGERMLAVPEKTLLERVNCKRAG